MTEPDEAVWRIWGGLHRLFLRLAGRMPDEWLTHVRTMLGTGDLAYLPDTVTGSVVQLGVPLTAAEVELLPGVLVALGVDGDPPVGLDQVSISEVTPATDHRFYPAPPGVLGSAGARIPASLDLTGGDSENLWDLPPDLTDLADLADDLADMTDDRVVVNLSMRAGVAGIWRAWRFGPDGPPKDGQRVYLAEVAAGVQAWELTHDAQRALVGKGEEFPQVEVYWTGDELPPYHRAARAGSALLWARQPGRVRVPPAIDASAARLAAGPERDRLLARLRAGAEVGGTNGRAVDAIEPSRGQVVPLTHRTDGQWVWSGAVAYYLGEYGLAPHPELMEHLLTAPQPDTVDGVGLFRAEVALRSASG